MRKGFTRRAALLGGVGLTVAGCETIDDIFGSSRPPLQGTRVPVLTRTEERRLEAEEGYTASITLPPPAGRADWPQAGGTLSHVVGHLDLPASLSEAWRSSFGTGSAYRRRITGVPVVADDIVAVADARGIVSAFDTARGGRRWRFDSERENESDGAVGAGMAFAEGTLYVTTGLAELIALDPANGRPRWRVNLPAPSRGAPTIAGNRILVPTIENQLLGLDTADGRRVWTYRSTPTATVPLGLPAPAVEGDVAVAGFASGELVSMRVADGRVLWTESLAAAGRSSLAEIAGIRALPVIADGRVIAVGMGGLSIAVDLRSGRRLWERDFGGISAPGVAGDWVFAVTDVGEAAAIGRDDGRIRWVSSLVPADRDIHAPGILATPVLAGGRLIIGSSRGELIFLDPADGSVKGRQRMPGGVTAQPAYANNTLFVATEDANLVALR
ncbi:MAG TPA: PQQ-binding-like beta-propeller repeat protein [Roseomonas sp.]|jgi:outer membrane protein assembly factor BamB